MYSRVLRTRPNLFRCSRWKSTRKKIEDGPALKDFLAATQHPSDTDELWDQSPYIQDGDIRARGRKGETARSLILPRIFMQNSRNQCCVCNALLRTGGGHSHPLCTYVHNRGQDF